MLTRRAALALPCLAAAVAAAAQEPEISLFDGVTTNGWLSITGKPFPAQTWMIENGCLKSIPPKLGAQQDLRTAEEFEFFDLTFDWKIAPGGNSGVKYSLAGVDSFLPKDDPDGGTGLNERARGFEFQLGDADTPDVQRGPQYSAGALYGICAPTAPATIQNAGVFNTARIVYAPTRIEHWINGRQLLALDPTSEEFAASVRAASKNSARLLTRPRRSPIALQHHRSEVWFRNLRIRPLPVDAAD